MALGIDYGYRQVKAIELLKTEQEYTISKIGIQPVHYRCASNHCGLLYQRHCGGIRPSAGEFTQV